MRAERIQAGFLRIKDVTGVQQIIVTGFGTGQNQITVESATGEGTVEVQIKPPGATLFHSFVNNTTDMNGGNILLFSAAAHELKFIPSTGDTYTVIINRV